MKTLENEKTFETLYGYDVKNKIKEWNICVKDHGDHSLMSYSYGYIDGKKVECVQKITKGKNIGKKNETTHYQQAILEAQSKWTRKSDEGYLTNLQQLKNQKQQLNTTQNNQKQNTKQIENLENEIKNLNLSIFPMLAQDFFKHRSKLKFPCYIQKKLDGYRLIYDYKSDKLQSRTGKVFGVLQNTELHRSIKMFCEEYIKKYKLNNVTLDGELYVHDPEFNFENYGILRKTKSLTSSEKETLNKIKYHIYDIINDLTFYQRYNNLQDFFTEYNSKNNNEKLVLVETISCENFDDIKKNHILFTQQNYEGSILRNKDAFYKCKARSSDLLKYKDFFDAEYEIVDYTFEKNTDKNNNENLIVWICKNEKDDLFNVRPKGNENERIMLYKKAQEFIGQQLWVKYFELTEAGIPRFPTTMRSSYTEYIRNKTF
jgi:ATP-dependent DNA ligase